MAKGDVQKWAESKRGGSGDYAKAKSKAETATSIAENRTEMLSSSERAHFHEKAAKAHTEAAKLAPSSREKKDHERYALEHNRSKDAYSGHDADPGKANYASEYAVKASAKASRTEATSSNKSRVQEEHRSAMDAHLNAAKLQLEAGADKSKVRDHLGRAELHAQAAGETEYFRDELGRFASK